MSVYVGIDVHRKRSQVAVINGDGEVLVNRNVPNGVTPILVTDGFSQGRLCVYMNHATLRGAVALTL